MIEGRVILSSIVNVSCISRCNVYIGNELTNKQGRVSIYVKKGLIRIDRDIGI